MPRNDEKYPLPLVPRPSFLSRCGISNRGSFAPAVSIPSPMNVVDHFRHERPLNDSLGEDSYDSDGNLSDEDVMTILLSGPSSNPNLAFLNRMLVQTSPLSTKSKGSEEPVILLTPNKSPKFLLIQLRGHFDQVIKCTFSIDPTKKSRVHRAGSMVRRSSPFLLDSDLLHQEWELKTKHADFFFPGPEDVISLVIQNEDDDGEEIEVGIDLFDGDETHGHIKQTLRINPLSFSAETSSLHLLE